MTVVPAAPGVSFFTPEQLPVAGSARNCENPPKLFQPLTVKSLTFQNRIALSPMVQLSGDDGHATPWHWTHLGSIITRGPGFAVVEATGITSIGRSAVTDLGIWNDSHVEAFKKITEYTHSQGQKIFLQLCHGGRKSSLVPTWAGTGRHTIATAEQGGWPDQIVAPSAIPYSSIFPTPRALTTAEVKEAVVAFRDAAARAIKAGFDGVEIHAAHGYLVHQFLSGVSNERTDEYGGSFENRTRFLLEVIDQVREVVPKESPILVRLSATDGLEASELADRAWTVEQSVRLAPLLVEHGVDILDVSAYGNHPDQKLAHKGSAYQAPFAKAIKAAVGDRLVVGTVGSIDSAQVANQVLEEGLDFVAVGRKFLMDPNLVYNWGKDLGVDVTLPHQYGWPFGQVQW